MYDALDNLQALLIRQCKILNKTTLTYLDRVTSVNIEYHDINAPIDLNADSKSKTPRQTLQRLSNDYICKK